MNKTAEEALDLLERDPYSYAPGSDTLESLVQYLIDEIRRLRAENKELRASYERVEKYGQILLIETGELKDELSLWKRNADR